jgi:hypothetical protein
MLDRTARVLLLGSSLAAALCACEPEDASYRWLPQAAVTGRRVALIDGHGEQLHLFDVARLEGDALPSSTHDLPEAPYALWERAGGGDDLIVAAGGERGGDQPPVLDLISDGGGVRRQPLAARYDALAQTEDGAYAIAHFRADARAETVATAQVAVIELDESRSARELGLERDGQPWSELWLSPALALADGAVHVAATSYARALGVLVLEHADAGPLFVTLTAEQALPAWPRQLVAIREQARIAWLGEGLDDVFVATLRSADGARGVALELAQHAAGSRPAALAVGASKTGAPVLLVVTGGGRELRVLDPERGEGPTLELDAAATAIAACTPSCAYVLLYSPGSDAATLVDVARAAAGDGAALRALQLPGTLAGVSVVEHGPGTGPYALGRHAGGGATRFDLEEGALHSVALDRAQTQSAQIGQDGGLWIAPAGGELVTRIDPVSRARFEVQLEAPLAQLVLVPEARLAVAIHSGAALALSVLSSVAPATADVVFVEDLP